MDGGIVHDDIPNLVENTQSDEVTFFPFVLLTEIDGYTFFTRAKYLWFHFVISDKNFQIMM